MNSSMSKQAGKLTDTFRSSRSGAAGPTTRGKAGKAQHAAPAAAAGAHQAAAAEPQPSPAEQQAEAEEALLRQFDLDSRFGPCMGITRLQRWERARKLELDPPAEVPEIVARHGVDSSFNVNLFAKPC